VLIRDATVNVKSIISNQVLRDFLKLSQSVHNAEHIKNRYPALIVHGSE